MSNDNNKYLWQRGSAKRRGISFNLTFDEWYAIWQQSGKYDQRGKCKGQYVMSRYNDIGAYEVGNVFIQLHSDNINDARKPLTESTKDKIRNKITGLERSSETKNKLRDLLLGKERPQKQVECPHCNKKGAIMPMNRWHFDNCKELV